MSVSERELVRLAQQGDVEAFDRLVGMHQERVHALAYRILGDCDDAADVQQETFLRAWRGLKKFRLDAEFGTWLHRITVNLCISRKRRRDRTVQLDEAVERRLISGGSMNTCLERSEIADALRNVLGMMPGHYRALIVLRDVEERSFEEISEILGCSVESARVRLCKARKVLRERMRPYLAEE